MRRGLRVLCILAAFWSAAAPAQDLSATIKAICGDVGATLPDDLKVKCDAARASALEQAVQAGALPFTPASSVALSISETKALKDKVDLVASVMKLDPTVVSTIKPTTVTVPDMSAASLATFAQGMDAAAQKVAKSVKDSLEEAKKNQQICPPDAAGIARSPVVVLMSTELTDLRRNYLLVQDAAALLDEQTTRYADFLGKAFSDPSAPITVTVTAVPGTSAAPDGPRFTSITAGLATAGLVVDLVGKTAALAASFRPVVSSVSGTATGDLQQIAQLALLRELAGHVDVVKADAIFPARASSPPGSVRNTLEELRASAYELRATAAMISEYDYVAAARRASVVVNAKDENGKPLSKKALEEAKKAERDRLVARATAKQAVLAKAITEAAALAKASDDLNAYVFVGRAAKDQQPAVAPLVFAFDQWEASQLGQKCVFTLTLPAASAQVDRHAEQRAFGAPRFYYKLSGVQPWQFGTSQGTLLRAGIMQTSADWSRFGPEN